MQKRLVVWFSDVDKEDIPLVGGKGANLGEMTHAGFPVPNGFIVTAEGYYQFVRENKLAQKIKHLLATTNFDKPESLHQVSSHIKKVIMHANMNKGLIKQIFDYYRKLGGPFTDALVAVRSSATAEDLPTASFAGQQATFLNVQGEANVVRKIKEAWASLFEARAIFYRHENHFDHFRVGIAVPVQKMVSSEQSGVMFTIDPVTNDKSIIVIEAIYGLGEYIVQGTVTPDHYEVDKHDMKIIVKKVAPQSVMYVKKGRVNKEVGISKVKGNKQKITDKQILALADLAKKLEKHYYFPQDSEWAIEKSKIFIVQTRPITTISHKSKVKSQNYTLNANHYTLLVKGDPASPGIASGPARIIHSTKEIGKVQSGDVLVAPQTNPDYVPAMKKAVAVVTDSGGRTSHAAIVSRELGIPAVVGSGKATKVIKHDLVITVNGSRGEVYKGGTRSQELVSQKDEFQIRPKIETKTHVYVNLAEPELAATVAKRHVDGVGLLRAEFMIAGIGVHPKKMIKDGKGKQYSEKLADQICMFAKAFGQRPVVYRTSDFKTNEYRALVGGREYEPLEPNPMLGFRGAYRYIADPSVFELELNAIKHVREKQGYKNLWVMIPFVRTVKELINVKKIISEAGLYRSESFKLWMMVEIPSNVILLEQFIRVGIDGISIGSNDLTMLTLGTDRDNSEVAHEFDERNDAVLWMLEKAIVTARKHKISASICGQAASLYPSLVEKLVEWGITSVSVSPDAIDNVRKTIYRIERKMK
ncbi:MAG: phosphoenolpyruvate synthase [Candidatus Levybacteria bacterium]|nr:phosphoenolpyruvate synthase [Candidatus Levybacteria bacterium]